jgi:hypothetical protein
MRPCVGLSIPAAILSSVVLPQPDWPRRQTSSPAAIDSETSSSARTEP